MGKVLVIIIYELEMFAGTLAVQFWSDKTVQLPVVWFGNHKAARFSLVKGSAEGETGQA